MDASTPARLDVRVILETAGRLFLPWLASVLLVTWAGYPGVVCVTPLAWLLAVRVGLRVSMRSKSPTAAQRILEAALAGGIFGLLQGALFTLMIGRVGEIRADEQTNAFVLTAAMTLIGMLAAAGLAALNAWVYESRREREAARSKPG
jgi:hypothetical protein